jgi:hypothetical protein
MKKLKANGLFFRVVRSDNKYADQYVDVVVYNDRKYSLKMQILAIVSDHTPDESNKGLFLYGVNGNVDVQKCEIIGVDMI